MHPLVFLFWKQPPRPRKDSKMFSNCAPQILQNKFIIQFKTLSSYCLIFLVPFLSETWKLLIVLAWTASPHSNLSSRFRGTVLACVSQWPSCCQVEGHGFVLVLFNLSAAFGKAELCPLWQSTFLGLFYLFDSSSSLHLFFIARWWCAPCSEMAPFSSLFSIRRCPLLIQWLSITSIC